MKNIAPGTSKYVVEGTADADLANAQFLGALATGLLKNTTTTGVLSIAAAGDIPDISATYVTITSNQTVSGVKTFSGGIAVTNNATIYGSRDIIQLAVRANSTQTTHLQEWQKSDGTSMAHIGTTGTIAVVQGALSSASPAISTSATWNTGVSSCNYWYANITDNTAVQNWLQVMQVNGANKWLIDKTGYVVAGNADAAFISTGVIAQARLGSGTPSNIKYLRGDGQWIVKWNIQVKNSNTTVGPQENLLWCDSSGSNISLTLPDVVSNNGIELMFIRGDASANTITLNRAGSDLFFPSGATSITIPVGAGKFVRLLALSIYWVNVGNN